MLRINLWSCPRNLSTALMYSFAQRPDTSVTDEPLYAHYFSVTDAVHPGREEVLAKMENDGKKVVREVILGEYRTPVVFHKQMTHHLVHLDEGFLAECQNLIFIRRPEEIIFSYAKVKPNPKMVDIGVKAQHDLYRRLEERGIPPLVLDARDLQMNPAGMLMQLCEALGLEYDARMLRWEPGGRPEDGCWARYWYQNLHQSTGFLPFREKQIQLEGAAAALAEECQPFYQFLYEKRIRPPQRTP